MNKLDLISIRDARPSDKSFIFATWLRGLRYGNDWFTLIDKDTYFQCYHKVLERILVSGVTIKVACLLEDPEVILGYSVSKDSRLDWVFVKKAWRNIGLAKLLIPQDLKTVSHITQVGKAIIAKTPTVKFDPFNL